MLATFVTLLAATAVPLVLFAWWLTHARQQVHNEPRSTVHDLLLGMVASRPLRDSLRQMRRSVAQHPSILERTGFLADVRRLHSSVVIVVGCGSVGSWVTHFLAMNFVGGFVLIDPDVVEPGNLGGRTAFLESQLGANKARALAAQLEAIDSGIMVEAFEASADILFAPGFSRTISGANLLINTFDDVPMLMRVADHFYRVLPQIFAGFHRNGSSGHVIFTRFPDTPCFRCSMGITATGNLARIDRGTALPQDIQRVSMKAAEAALGLLAADQPTNPLRARLGEWRSNYLFVDNRSAEEELLWIPTQRRVGCRVCNTN